MGRHEVAFRRRSEEDGKSLKSGRWRIPPLHPNVGKGEVRDCCTPPSHAQVSLKLLGTSVVTLSNDQARRLTSTSWSSETTDRFDVLNYAAARAGLQLDWHIQRRRWFQNESLGAKPIEYGSFWLIDPLRQEMNVPTLG